MRVRLRASFNDACHIYWTYKEICCVGENGSLTIVVFRCGRFISRQDIQQFRMLIRQAQIVSCNAVVWCSRSFLRFAHIFAHRNNLRQPRDNHARAICAPMHRHSLTTLCRALSVHCHIMTSLLSACIAQARCLHLNSCSSAERAFRHALAHTIYAQMLMHVFACTLGNGSDSESEHAPKNYAMFMLFCVLWPTLRYVCM